MLIGLWLQSFTEHWNLPCESGTWRGIWLKKAQVQNRMLAASELLAVVKVMMLRHIWSDLWTPFKDATQATGVWVTLISDGSSLPSWAWLQEHWVLSLNNEEGHLEGKWLIFERENKYLISSDLFATINYLRFYNKPYALLNNLKQQNEETITF